MRHPRPFARVLAALTLAAAALAGPAAVLPAHAVHQDFPITDTGASTQDVQDVLDAAKAYTDAAPDRTASVTFGPGTFTIDDDLYLDEAERLTIRGAGDGAGGTKILMNHYRKRIFEIDDSTDITISDLQLDHPDEALPWTQLTVVDASGYVPGAGAGYVDVEVDTGYPEPTSTMFDPYVNSSGTTVDANVYGYPLAADGSLTVRYFRPHTDATEDGWRYELEDQPGVYRLHFVNTSNSTFEEGQRIALGTAIAEGMTLSFRRNTNLTIERVTNRASSYMGLWSQGVERLTLRDYHAEPGPGRLLSSTRDAVHLTGYNRGQLLIENSTFRASGDDAINFNMITSGGLTRVSDTEVRVTNATAFRADDDLEIYRASDRSLVGTAVVDTVTQDPGALTGTVTFEAALTGMTTGDRILNNDAAFVPAIIQRNTFGNNRGRGILPMGRDVTIDDNTFDRTPLGVLVRSVPTAAGEGPIPANVNITNNRFIGQNHGSAIEIGGDAVATAAETHATNYRVTDNVFTDLTVPAVRVEHGQQVRIERNTLTPDSDARINAIELGTFTNQPDGVVIDDFDVVDPTGATVQAGVFIARGTTGVEIGDVTGGFRGPVFVNNTSGPITYQANPDSRLLGPAGLPPTGWGFATGTGGWTAANCVTLGAGGGRLHYTATCGDSYMHSPSDLSVPATTVAAVKLTLRNATAGTTGQLYFTTAADPTWNSTQRVAFTVPASMASEQEIIIPVGGSTAWTGTITRLRLDLPDQAAASDTVTLDSITLSPTALSTEARPSGTSEENRFWDFENSTDGITTVSMSPWQRVDGDLVFTNAITDPPSGPKVLTQDNLGIDAGDYRYLRLTFRNGSPSTQLSVFFTTNKAPTTSESRRLNFRLAPSSGPVTYYLHLNSGQLGPDDIIKRLRLDFPWVNGQQVESAIEEFALVSDLSVDAVNS